jgi:hypothetical protein
MSISVINKDTTADTPLFYANPTRRIFGTTDAFASMLTDVSRKFRYFVIETENGGVQIKFTNTNPDQPQ